MTSDELKDLLDLIQRTKCETQTLELKSATYGCPKRLYDTLSSFSNQDTGGIIVFGVSEDSKFKETGVYDAHDLQKRINEQCLQMEPPVRALLTATEKGGKFFVSAEIPGIDIAERPCFYQGKGRIKGSYTRVGDSDEPMTEYEVYRYEAFRKKHQDDIRTVPRASFMSLNKPALDEYMIRLRKDKPHLAKLEDSDIYELMSITWNREVTLAAELLFGLYPQAYFPQFCITAVSVPGTKMGEIGESDERFIDNRRMDGTIPEMLEDALAFVHKNMKIKTIVSGTTGAREDKPEYPIPAVREAVLNALVHRDYSVYTEGTPITIEMYEDRMEIRSPGGLYGRTQLSQLGKTRPDTRNPALATALETMRITENRYSGIPTIRRELAEQGLPEPRFVNEDGSFTVVFYKTEAAAKVALQALTYTDNPLREYGVRENATGTSFGDRSVMTENTSANDDIADAGTQYDGTSMKSSAGNASDKPVYQNSSKDPHISYEYSLAEFCREPRTRAEIAEFLNLDSQSYAISTYVTPLVKEDVIKLTIPDKPRSPKQRYYSEWEEK